MRIFFRELQIRTAKVRDGGLPFFVFRVMNIVQHQCIIDPPRLGLHASFGGFFWPDSKLNAGGKP